MNTVPPGPPWQAPGAPGGPAAPGAPDWSALTLPPPAPKRRPTALLVVVGLGVLGAVAAAVLLLGGGDGGEPSIDTADAVDGLTTIIEDETEDGFALLDRCPLAGRRDVQDALDDAAGLDLDLSGDAFGFAERDGDDGGNVICSFVDTGSADEDSAVVAAYLDPRGREFRGLARDAEGDVEDGDDRALRGGTLQSFCTEDGGTRDCTAGWSADGLLLVLFVSSDDITDDAVRDTLELLLDSTVATLADEA